jgi:hypothetical protein
VTKIKSFPAIIYADLSIPEGKFEHSERLGGDLPAFVGAAGRPAAIGQADPCCRK